MPIGGNANLAGSGQALDASLNIVVSEHKLLRDEDGLLRRLATPYNLEPHSGVSKIVLNYDRLTSYDLTTGVEVGQAQALGDSQTAYTPAEAGLQVVLTKKTLNNIADPSLYKRVGRMMELAYEMKEEEDGADEFSSFTNALGQAADVLGPGHIHAGAARMRIGNTRRTSSTKSEPAPPPLAGVFHPLSLSVAMGRLVPFSDVPTGTNDYDGTGATGDTRAAGASSLGDEVLRKRVLTRLSGVPIFESAHINVDGSDDATSAMLSQEGLIYVNEFEPGMFVDEIEGRFFQLTYSGSYAWGVYRPSAYGLGMTFDASLPTT